MARRMVAADGQLVSFSTSVTVLASTDSADAEIWTRLVKLVDSATPGQFAKAHDVPSDSVDAEFSIPTPPFGFYLQVRMFALRTGSPSGDGLLIDELILARLNPNGRKTYLTDCSEGIPAVEISPGGTYVRGLVASGRAVSLGQLFLGRGEPRWQTGDPFPVFEPDDLLLSAVASGPAQIHDVTVVDRRDDGWTTGPRLTYGTPLWFVALVWDGDGGWDVAWSQRTPMPPAPGPGVPPPEQVRTLDRVVTVEVRSFYCLDDSDDLSDGEASFDLTLQPSDGTPRQSRTVDWKPMESNSAMVLSESFVVTGPAAGNPTFVVRGEEDDGEVATTDALRLTYPVGPGVESFRREATLDADSGDDFHFQVVCSATVTYV